MIALIQRVTQASVSVEGEQIAAIERGILALIAVTKSDEQSNALRLLERLLAYRLFEDEDGKMNLSLSQIGEGLLLVPQFTLAADTRKGNRASFSSAAAPERGRQLYELLLDRARELLPGTQSGRFGANMQVGLINDGPVTFWIEG